MTAVLFLTYRRFHTAERVFEAIRQAQPPRLYFASNAPNPENEGEDERVSKVRGLLERVDWGCKVKKLFREKHLPVKDSIPSSIDWFFEHEDKGIILEDDCLPNHTFFTFCDELLEYYRNHEKIMMISGQNWQKGIKRGNASYYFSKHVHIWGWATWKRAWQLYDIDMKAWPKLKKSGWISTVFPGLAAKLYWTRIFDKAYKGKINTWDYQWNFACWKSEGLSCVPATNLISNIGFGKDSVHCYDSDSEKADEETNDMEFPLKHEKKISRHLIADNCDSQNSYGISLWKELKRALFSKLSFRKG